MKLIILSLIISIFAHLLIFNTYQENTPITNIVEKIEHKKNNITYVKIKKISPPKKNVPVKIVKKITPKKKIKKIKEVIKKKILSKKVKKNTEQVKKPISYKEKQKTNYSLEGFLSQEEPSKIVKKTLESFLQEEEPINKKMLSQIERLYGREFETFTKIQKAFLKKNLDNFQQITQKVLNRLGYPRLAGKLRISGTNIVEFDFFPNGAIKNLKITSSSGYTIFDDYTLELIQIAYKDYPRPKTVTKLKFNVIYRMY